MSNIDGGRPRYPDNYPDQDHDQYDQAPGSEYALSGKIMLTAIVILFAVVIVMVCLHLYARWYLLRSRRRHLLQRNRRRAHLVFYVDPNNPSATVNRGLDASVLKSLPVFVYSSETHSDSIECAVCLSEFEDNEKGRMLPKCNHSFHIGCIDMWFHSHSTCPLCRSPVEPAGITQNEVVVTVNDEPVDIMTTAEEEAGPSSSGLCSSCKHDEEGEGMNRSWWSSSSAAAARAGTSSFGARRKPLEMRGVSIEVPRRNESFGRSDDEFMTESPASQSYKSPGGRIRSLKRILSRGLSPSSGAAAGTSFGSASANCSEFDLERGRDESTYRSRVHTPR